MPLDSQTSPGEQPIDSSPEAPAIDSKRSPEQSGGADRLADRQLRLRDETQPSSPEVRHEKDEKSGAPSSKPQPTTSTMPAQTTTDPSDTAQSSSRRSPQLQAESSPTHDAELRTAGSAMEPFEEASPKPENAVQTHPAEEPSTTREGHSDPLGARPGRLFPAAETPNIATVPPLVSESPRSFAAHAKVDANPADQTSKDPRAPAPTTVLEALGDRSSGLAKDLWRLDRLGDSLRADEGPEPERLRDEIGADPIVAPPARLVAKFDPTAEPKREAPTTHVPEARARRLEMDLQTAEGDEVRVRISSHGRRFEAEVLTDNPTLRHALRAESPELARLSHEHGLSMGSFSVGSGAAERQDPRAGAAHPPSPRARTEVDHRPASGGFVRVSSGLLDTLA